MPDVDNSVYMSENELMKRIQVAMSALGARLFRNNVGQFRSERGDVIRYGVANPGGSDLIGWTPIKITADMVGQTIAIFTAIEVKSQDGRLSKHQRLFIDVVHSSGGIAVCARSIEHAVGAVSERRTTTD